MMQDIKTYNNTPEFIRERYNIEKQGWRIHTLAVTGAERESLIVIYEKPDEPERSGDGPDVITLLKDIKGLLSRLIVYARPYDTNEKSSKQAVHDVEEFYKDDESEANPVPVGERGDKSF